jgi:hypothetical protein
MALGDEAELPVGEARSFNPYVCPTMQLSPILVVETDGVMPNRIFLVYLLICSGISVFYLLYFNRVFAWAVAQFIRTWTWHKYRVDITFQALQISILGGRIFFTGARYNGQNETFHVQSGHVTWRYWNRRVRHVDIGKKRPESEEAAERNAAKADGQEEGLPCRINISLIGLEWFVYNRSPAYESVLDGLGDNAGGGELGSDGRHASKGERREQEAALPFLSSGNGGSVSSDSGESTQWSLPMMLQFFPVSVSCQKAALVMGNENTKAMLVVKTDHVSGIIDAGETAAPDPYRQLFKAHFRRPVVEFRENDEYREDQESRATKEKRAAADQIPTRKRSWLRRQRKRVLGRLRTLVPYWNKSVDSLSTRSIGTGESQHAKGGHWQGLSRYLHEDQGDKARWASVEYGAVTTIVDSPSASMTMFWDSVAKVGRPCNPESGDAEKWATNINGGPPPAWGMTFSIHGGSVNYGPWADRQRTELQRFFFPSLCKDVVPAKPLAPGTWRVATQFTLHVELDDEVVLKVPVREDSKNWKFKGKEPPTQLKQPRQRRKQRGRSKKPSTADAAQFRPAGWLDLKVGANATVSVSMDMVAGPAGYSMTVDVDLPNTELSSSVNQEILWRSSSQRIKCDLSSPLQWNGLRCWKFDVESDNLELFILRDHVFLLIDLIDDWTAGPPADYLVFTPFKYFVNMTFNNLKLYLNANDANIINNPTSLDDNTYIIGSVPSLQANVCIPVEKFRPDRNAVPFDVRVETLDVSLHLPPWNTQATFVPSKAIGRAHDIRLKGQYQFNSTTSVANTDTLVMDVSGRSPVVTFYGFVIRYCLNLKDNYFGENIHFKTLEEHQASRGPPPPGTTAPTTKPYQPSNDLDIILGLRIDDARVMLPANVYSPSKHVVGETATISVDLRLTNYYMDLDISVSPISLSLGNGDGPVSAPRPEDAVSTQLFVDGLAVYGHRLLGLPPTEPTYLCIWDLNVGAVSGECSAEFLAALARGGKAFIFNFDDEENALVPYSSIILYDITFLRVAIESVNLWLHVDEAAFLLSTSTIDVSFNDWARSHYSRRGNIKVPHLQLSCVNSDAASIQPKGRYHLDMDTDALLRTGVHIGIIGRKYNFTEERRLQQELLRREDRRTQRAPFLVLPGLTEDLVLDPVDPPAQCVPVAPPPLPKDAPASDGSSMSTAARSTATRSLRKKSSFLSLSGSSDSSILRPSTSSRSRSRAKMSDALRPLTSISVPARSATHKRELSASTGYSAFYSAVGDYGHVEQHARPPLPFSSPYLAPHFPLQSVQPDPADMTIPSAEEDYDSIYEPAGFDLEDIDPAILGEDQVYTSIMLEFPGGLTGSFNPTSVRHAASLLTALQSSTPEDILDGLQTGCVTDIVDLKRLIKAKGEVKDFLIRLPSANLRFRNSSPLDSVEPPHDEQDQYDVALSKLTFVMRETVTWDDPFRVDSRQSRKSLHARLGSADVAVSERLPHTDETQAAVMGEVQDVRISMGSRDVTYVDADIGAVRGSTASGKIEYLASLIHRTNVVATEVGNLLSETITRQEERLKFFVHSLASRSPETGDPLFFIRPSAVLRSAPGHLRTFDSWKMALRLRQIWTAMTPVAKEELALSCLGPRAIPPDNAHELVTAAFKRWRGWDLGNLADSLLMREVFGPPERPIAPPVKRSTPLLAVCQVHEIELVLDPGPKENKVRIADISARLERNDKRNGSTESVSDVEGPLTVLNVCCQDASLQLNWELCELANDVLRLYNEARTASTASTPEPEPEVEKRSTAPTKPHGSFHVVLSIDRGSVRVDTVNLSASSLTQGLKASLLLHSTETGGAASNFVFDCDAVTTRLYSRSQVLGMFQLRDPSIFAAHNLEQTDTTSYHTIKSTASSRSLTLRVRQDPIALLEVVDLLIRDEAAQLYRLKELLPRSGPPPTPRRRKTKKITDRLSAYRVNVAMFLDEYDITLPLLQSLTYNISGVVARAAMAANFGKEVIFDFDIKENAHEMQISVNNKPKSISLLRIPPTNGRITSLISPTKNSVNVFSSLELVELDASAVYSLLRAINRPEISSALTEIQEQFKMIQGHVDDLLGTGVPVESEPATSAKSQLVYSVHMTLAGLHILGKTKLKMEAEPLAQFLFTLDSVHFGMCNQLEESGPLLDHPEVHVNLRQIALDLKKGREGDMRSCGSLAFGALLSATTRTGHDGKDERTFSFNSNGLDVNLSPDTVSTLVDVAGYLGEKIKDLDTSREVEYLRKLRQSRPKIAINDEEEAEAEDIIDSFLSTVVYQFEVRDIRVCWMVVDMLDEHADRDAKEDLVVTIKLIEFGTRKTKSARLTIRDFQLEMVPPDYDSQARSHHSALMPEVIFNVAYVSTPHARRMAFQAVGKSLDLRLTSGFILPASNLNNSIALSAKKAQQAALQWTTSGGASMAASKPNEEERGRSIFGTKRLESLLVDADFAGAVVHLSAKKDPARILARRGRGAGGKYGQFTDDTGGSTVLRTPGLALKLEYRDPGREDPTLYGEIKVEGSSNILYPSVVPLMMDITSNITEVVSDDQDTHDTAAAETVTSPKPTDEDKILSADPSVVLGRLRLNLGLRICKQEFSLSCQPIARVAANACFEDIYVTVNTVRSKETGNFFAISAAFTNMQASVQHVYSRESTGNFELDSMVLSLMNSKHVSGTSGVSAILKLSPMKVAINAKQLQDFLLFREIWYPSDMARPTSPPVAKLQTEASQGHLVQRYQQVAATAAFPWTATISISSLEINVDLGQAIGKSVLAINDFWIQSKKTSDWEQNLCLGFQRIGADCTGRLSGFVALQDFRLRTSIQWPEREQALSETPLIQASIGFSQLRLKAAFDYQAFLVADITSLEFLMYNVRQAMEEGSGDRLVAILDGQAVQVFGTTTSAAQGILLWQTLQKLVQERRANFEMSLREIEKFMRRKSSSLVTQAQLSSSMVPKLPEDDTLAKSPISLDTDVVVTLKALNLGVFPSTFSDHQVFKMEALDAQARFAASMEHRRIRSILDLTLGQLRIGLAGVRNIEAPLMLNEISVEDVVERATGSRGGTILKVPRVHAAMETWQSPKSNRIDYIFKSSFEGKVEVGWNYSRISYIRGMWANHSKTLAHIWGRELAPMTAIKVTGVPEPDTGTSVVMEAGGEESKAEDKDKDRHKEQQKITAEVKVPQSKYQYVALEEPIIETPRLRDMGEATPPLEWIGLHRDRLPNLTHQIVIVTLLELAGEVEDAYSKILGSS